MTKIIVWIVDRAHAGCKGKGFKDQVRDLRPLRPEQSPRMKRGPKRGPKTWTTHFWVGLCCACGQPRLFGYIPREQRVLDLPALPERAGVAS